MSRDTDQWGRTRLAHRTADGIEVSLVLSKPAQRLTVEVYDTRTREGFELEVGGREALDAFHRPYAYAAALRTPLRVIEKNAWRWQLADAA
jgi:hypothetical protein